MTNSTRPLPPAPGVRRQRWHRALVLCGLCGAILAGGCGSVVKSIYRRPALEVPAQWRGTAFTTGAEAARSDPWWHRFGDPKLDALIDKALRTNNNLAAAALAVYSAQLQASLTDTNLSPAVSLQASRSNLKNLVHGGPALRASSTTTSVSYEIDLWGRLARLRDAAAWEAQASAYDRRAVALSLIGATATLYWQIAYLNDFVATLEESIRYARQTLDVVHTQHMAGAAGAFEEAQSRMFLASLKAELTQVVQLREADRNALAILFNQAPDHREVEADSLAVRPMPALPAVLPADLLGRRPDLQAAESRLRETRANADATRLNFYPTFSLVGTVGTSGMTLVDILKNPLGTLGATLALPFVQWNTAQLTIKASKADFDAAAINFRQTFYQALSDAQSALAAREQSQTEVDRRQIALTQARRAEALGEIRYRAGETGLQDWLNLQQNRLDAHILLEQSVYTQYVNQMTLYQALGGDLRASDRQPWHPVPAEFR